MTNQKNSFPFVSSLLIFALFFTMLPLQSMATGADADIRAQAVQLIDVFDDMAECDAPSVEQVSNDLAILEGKHWDPAQMSIHTVKEDGTVIYKQQLLEDIVAYIDVREEADGSIYMHFVEGDLENTVQFTPDNEIYLDGRKVTFESETTVSLPEEWKPTAADELIIKPKAGAIRYTSKSVPGGTKVSEYTGKDHVFDSTKKVDFAAKVGTIAVTALVTIISNGFSAFWGALNRGISNAAFKQAANWLKSKHPYTRYASFQDIRNSRPKDNVIHHYKHSVYAYSEAGYGGSRKLVDTYYEIYEPTR